MRAVAFDYRDTLAAFRWDDGLWRRGIAAMLAVAGADAALLDRAAAALRRRLDRRAGPGLAELDYPALVAEVLAEIGVAAGAGIVDGCVEAEYRAWAPARHVHPDTLTLLDGIHGRGLACALVANTFDPPALFRADLDAQGIGGRMDAIVLSAEVGVRKPHPAVYAGLVERLGVEPEAILFVGDRLADDVDGPAATGMLTCLAAWYRRDPQSAGRPVTICTEPLHVLEILEALVGSGSPGKI